MATDDAEVTPPGELDEFADAGSPRGGTQVVVGEYTWADLLREYGYDARADELDDRAVVDDGAERGDGAERDADAERDVGSDGDVDGPGEGDPSDVPPRRRPLTADDVRAVGVDPAELLGYDPDEVPDRASSASDVARHVTDQSPLIGYDETPVYKDIYTWKHYEEEYFLDEEGNPPTDEEGEPEEFTHGDRTDALGFDPDAIEDVLGHLSERAPELDEVVEERTVNVNEDLDEDAFFSDPDGTTTVTNRYDLEKAVPMAKKTHFREVERYWVNEPYSFVVVFHSTKENEKKYYVVEPYRNPIEDDLTEFLEGKLRSAIKYADEGVVAGEETHRREVIREETYELLERYDLYEREGGEALGNALADRFDVDPDDGIAGRLVRALGYEEPVPDDELEGISARPEPAVVAEDPETLTEYTVRKLLYYLRRDFIGYERIDGIKHDINVEDVSCDGYNSPVFVYHGDYEQIISNVYHGETELDDFVVKLAQRSGKGISKRRPQVDATLPDGSRAQLTLGREVSDHGTNYTIRQFKDVPFTPIDLVNWTTFSLDEMTFLWLCIENHKSLIFAGGTASGKTTSLNAVSLFIPSNSKIVSIEDTREVELPQRNWIASVTRPSFSEDDKGDVDEFDLLEAALRQRPDYIVMGEIRGEEGRTLFQVMSTGHTTYTTFHADSVGEVLKRFTTDPINVSKTMFSALDLVSVQTSTRVQGRKVRRNKSLTEINHYDAENDEINVQDVYQWQAESDSFLKMGESNTLEEIAFDRGWSHGTLQEELRKRRVVLAYLIDRGLNTYTQVAATLQAFINDPDTILALIANDELEASLEDLREMESVLIDVDPDKEEMVPRPDPTERTAAEATDVLDDADDLLAEYRGRPAGSVLSALGDVEPERTVEADPDDGGEFEPAATDSGGSETGFFADGFEEEPHEVGSGTDAGGEDSGGGARSAFDAVDQFTDGDRGGAGPDDGHDGFADGTGVGADGIDGNGPGGGLGSGDGSTHPADAEVLDGDESEDDASDETIEDWGFGDVENPGDG
ncbi:type II/IV secretion system ATPase subunit [Halorarum salinum]|uniref:Type II/IV secretion system ATPase subunit n=1 Tax=Halorarum salinum TaxID=2743089 RepID=A0A7D5QI85_9EURY|nr:type II/IV secretion system ATPase subunit [Halobaculum salinum]QLG62804.1 type II/IV secretion system ATPase subunit [Halobaculum salinum]